jgi:hypothetical protein
VYFFGIDSFRVICEQDLEGIVAKRREGAYGEDWFKIRNPNYSQYEGRHELFEHGEASALGDQGLLRSPGRMNQS